MDRNKYYKINPQQQMVSNVLEDETIYTPSGSDFPSENPNKVRETKFLNRNEEEFDSSNYRAGVVGRRGGNETKKNNYNERVRDQLNIRNNPRSNFMSKYAKNDNEQEFSDRRVNNEQRNQERAQPIMNAPMKMGGSALSNAQTIEKERSRGLEIDRNQQSLLKDKQSQFFEFNTRDYDDDDEFEVLQVEEDEYKNYNFKKNSDDLMIERSRFS